MFGCASNVVVESRPEPTNSNTPRDYFETVFWSDVGSIITIADSPYMEKVGEIRIQDYGSKESLLNDAMRECRKLGGNWIILNSYLKYAPGASFSPDRCSLLKATAFNRISRDNESFVGQLVKKGPTESQLKETWTTYGISQYEGIYQSITLENNYKLKVGFQKFNDDKYYMMYISGMGRARSWVEGDVIGIFESSAIQGVFLGDWVKLDKYSTSAELVFDNNGSFIVSYIPWNQSKKLDLSYIRTYPKDTVAAESDFASGTGTGFLLSTKGYIVTCLHVIQSAKNIYVIDNNNRKTRLSASVAVADANNDLCILKVSGLSQEYGSSLPYGFDDILNKTGESVFCMGYPLTQVMGNEIKVTNGIISSVTGYKGDVSSYQISAPAQPGNSGGPLFNSAGNVIGVINAKISQAENVSYAVKTSYLNNLISLLSDDVGIGKINQSSSSLSTLVEKFKPAVYIIEVEY